LDSFTKIITREKLKRYEEVGRDIGLTFDAILSEERLKTGDTGLE
jgi:hypothetical protein